MNIEPEPNPSSEPIVDPTPNLDPNPNPSLVNEPSAEPKPEPEPDPAAAPEPLTLETLSIPEGFEIPEEQSAAFLEIMNGDQSPSDRANALLGLYAKVVTEGQEAATRAWDDTQTEWKTQAQTDFGADLQPKLTGIARLIDDYGTPELKGVFDLTGAGNHPQMIRFLANIAEKLNEPDPNPGSPGAGAESTAAQRLFPTMKG